MNEIIQNLKNQGWKIYGLNSCGSTKRQLQILDNNRELYVACNRENQCWRHNIRYTPFWVNSKTNQKIQGIFSLKHIILLTTLKNSYVGVSNYMLSMYILAIIKSIFNIIYIIIFVIYKSKVYKKIDALEGKNTSFLHNFNLFEKELKGGDLSTYLSHNRMVYFYFFISIISSIMTAVALTDFKGYHFNGRVQ